MHLLPIEGRSLDEVATAIDLDHSPADMLLLSFTDADLAVAAAAWQSDRDLPSLRLVNLSRLKHPYSVDLFIEKLAMRARAIVVRLLGGADYWRYGLDELSTVARRNGIFLAVLPGDDFDDPRLGEASTAAGDDLATLGAYFREGGVDNVRGALRLVAQRFGHAASPAEQPRPVPPAGIDPQGCRTAGADAPHILLLFYRSILLAADTAPILALADALAARGAAVTAVYVTSLKDPASIDVVTAVIAEQRPDVVVTTTAFSAADGRGSVLGVADAPVLQAILSGSDREAWAQSSRGLRAADLAMNVVLPEVDGRIGTDAISFKAEALREARLEYGRVTHQPDQSGIARVADRALAWATLRRLPRSERRLACVLSDYPGKDGRAGYAVGLDTPASILVLANRLSREGFDIPALPKAGALMAALSRGKAEPILGLEHYRALLATLPQDFVDRVSAAWGDPADDPAVVGGAFEMRIVRAGKLVLAIQPDRGSRHTRRADYHDPSIPPRHAYVAFYLWLRCVERIHAMIHLGTHGTLEWLPGKAAALSPSCAPAVLTFPLPVIYPFIVNNPGEAAQAKRRIGAVTLGHMTPPLIEAGSHGSLTTLEQLFDEYAEATTLDPRRARLLSEAILDQAETDGLLPAGTDRASPEAALAALDAWLCDLKEMRIGDGLHILGSTHETAGELTHLVAALDGRFVPPGPAGAPSQGRQDVLPTGRNLYSVDPRAVPTRTAWELGQRLATALITRHAQDHGTWLRTVVLDLWGSATMRTGGDDLAQAFALLGTRPRWDHASTRINGFEILPLATLGRPRVDVTLRISGLFRDTFPDQIALFDAAVDAVARLDESEDENPLVAAARSGASATRIFGAGPGTYGIGIARRLSHEPATARDALGATYLEATSHGFDKARPDGFASPAFRDRVATAEAFSHTGDLPGQDALDSDTFAEHEGGFAAAAALLGGDPVLYRADTTTPEAPRLRPLADEIARALHARAINPRWIAGQMRHGHRGAIALAETLDALFAYAATTHLVPSDHFERYFAATCGDDAVRDFLESQNPDAARAMARVFEAALAHGHWVSRRNSTRAILDEMRGLQPVLAVSP